MGHAAELYTSSGGRKELDLKVANGEYSTLNQVMTMASRIMNDPTYKNFKLHVSKESIKSYYNGWAIQKLSPWKEAINRHLLILDQVNYIHETLYINIKLLYV